jgi:hypothetical protein
LAMISPINATCLKFNYLLWVYYTLLTSKRIDAALMIEV